MTSELKNRTRLFRAVSAALSPFHVEIDKVSGGTSVLIYGVLGINEFSESFVSVSVKDLSLGIFGEALCMTVYENKTVEIIGSITKLEYGI